MGCVLVRPNGPANTTPTNKKQNKQNKNKLYNPLKAIQTTTTIKMKIIIIIITTTINQNDKKQGFFPIQQTTKKDN